MPPCRAPALILEGEGDKEAVPLLIRRLLVEHEIADFHVQPNPIIRQTISGLRAPGQLERFLTYSVDRDGDSVLVLLDCDDDCPKEVVETYIPRVQKMYRGKNVGFAFFRSEYESLFICCLDIIAERYPDFGWNLDGWTLRQDHEAIRGAKQYLSRHMKSGRAYKEVRDQARFTSALDFERLRTHSRSFRHFESTLLWLRAAEQTERATYPLIAL